MILALDIKTLVAVLVLGNAIAVFLLFFDTRKRAAAFDRLFMLGRALQCAAWTLIVLRGAVPDLLSFGIGNSLMFFGVGLEGLCILSLKRPIGPRWRLLFAALVAVSLIAWWVPGLPRDSRLFVSALVDSLCFIIPGCFLIISGKRPSPLQKFIGVTLILCSIATIARGTYVVIAGGYSLVVPTVFQVLVLLVRVLVMILGSTGYILIRREFANEDLEAAATEKTLLLQELQHRVKNSLAIITGLTSLEMDRQKDEAFRSSLAKVHDRIIAVAKLYDGLVAVDPTKAIRLDEYVRDLAESLYSGYTSNPERISLVFELERVELDAKRAIAVGLIVNELTTNAMKYAFPGDAKGRISVRVARREGGIEVEVADDGIGETAGAAREGQEGLGTLIVTMLARQIGGTLSRGPGPGTSSRGSGPGTAIKVAF